MKNLKRTSAALVLLIVLASCATTAAPPTVANSPDADTALVRLTDGSTYILQTVTAANATGSPNRATIIAHAKAAQAVNPDVRAFIQQWQAAGPSAPSPPGFASAAAAFDTELAAIKGGAK